MNDKSRVLVTGGSGLVGQAIQKLVKERVELEEKYEFLFLSSKDCNLGVELEVGNLFAQFQPDIVIHLAAQVGGLYLNMREPVDMLEKNLLINYHIIKFSHQFQVKQLIGCLSTCIFPNKIIYPITEEQLHEGPPHDSNFAYSYIKRMLEIQIRCYREQYGSNFSCVTPTNIYGPYDNCSLENGHVIPGLIHQAYLSHQHHTPFQVRGTGKPRRQFLYSYDLARVFLELIGRNKLPDNIIISPTEEYSIGEVAEIIRQEFEISELAYQKNYADGQFKKTVSNSRLLTLLPDFKFTKLEDGLKETITWFRTHYPEVRM